MRLFSSIVLSSVLALSAMAQDLHPIKRVYPKYTAQTIKDKVEGVVILTFDVKDGKPFNIKVLRKVHPDLDKAAVDAFTQWRFTPGPEAKERAIEFSFTYILLKEPGL